jgi:branched-chain amino acid transport system ATP-binding protein
VLKLNDVWASYGDRVALQGVSLELKEHQIVTVLGANGAGKSTMLRVIVGLLPTRQGQVLLDGRSLVGLRTDEIVRMGVVLVPEGRRLFTEMNVRENLLLGAYTRRDGAGVRGDIEKVLALFPALEARSEQPAGLLSGGEQQMLAIARALMAKPRVLLLDEPSGGLAPLVIDAILDVIQRLAAEESIGVLLVEQNAEVALSLAHKGYVLETGRVVLSGSAAELQADTSVRRAYLGY